MRNAARTVIGPRFRRALFGATLALGVASAGLAHAQAYGTQSEAATRWQYIDSNGVHPEPGFDCSTGPSAACGPGARSSSTGWSTAALDSELGAISGSVLAQNSAASRIRSGATSDGSWWDTFTVSGAGLDPSTQVDLRMTVDLDVTDFQASITAPVPYTEVLASINLGGPDAPSIAGESLFDVGQGVGVGFLRVQVDTPFTLFGRFHTQTYVDDSPFQEGRTTAAASYFVDVVGIHALSSLNFRESRFASADSGAPGLRLISASGHDYSSTANAGGVPEPATWTMLIGGLGAVGAMVRRRRMAT